MAIRRESVAVLWLTFATALAGGGCSASASSGGGRAGAGTDAGVRADAGPGVDGGLTECEGIGAEAEHVLAPVDIVWVVDSSASMDNDARAVQDNLDELADFIDASGIDFRLILVSSRSFVTPSPRFDTDPGRFLFVDRHVGSGKLFQRALDQHPMYEHFLRERSLTHVVGVTDDDDDMGAATFVTMMEALLGHPFAFHAVAAEAGSFGLGCTRPGDVVPAPATGTRYFDAADRTGGLKLSICTGDWSALFATLAATVAVSEALPCVYDLPDPPSGMTFDRDRVNVEHTPEGGAAETFRRANGEDACGTSRAWYYDDVESPTQILLCPAACDAVSGPGRLDVRLGCETLLI